MDAREAIPLHPRRRLIGTGVAAAGRASAGRTGPTSRARGPTGPATTSATIDWKTSARLSSARNGDEFIVRERFSDEMPAVILVADRRPAMAAVSRAELPWLSKPEAVLDGRSASSSRARSSSGRSSATSTSRRTTAERAGAPFWEPAAGAARPVAGRRRRSSAASTPTVRSTRPRTTSSARWSSSPRCDGEVTIGTFVFVLSDFHRSGGHCSPGRKRSRGLGRRAGRRPGSDLGAEFPAIDGVRVLLADALEEHARYVRLNEVDVAERRKHNEQRLAGLRTEFARLGLDTIVHR